MELSSDLARIPNQGGGGVGDKIPGGACASLNKVCLWRPTYRPGRLLDSSYLKKAATKCFWCLQYDIIGSCRRC